MNQLQIKKFNLIVNLSVSSFSISYCSFEHTDTVFLFQFYTAEANENRLGEQENFQSFHCS